MKSFIDRVSKWERPDTVKLSVPYLELNGWEMKRTAIAFAEHNLNEMKTVKDNSLQLPNSNMPSALARALIRHELKGTRTCTQCHDPSAYFSML